MKICGVVILIIVILGIAGFWEKKRFIILLICAGLCFAGAAVSEAGQTREKIEAVEKADVGEAGLEKNLVARVGDEELRISVSIPEREYTKKEALEILEREKQLLNERILGKNESFEKIEYDLELPNEGTDPAVLIEWYSSEPDVISWEGSLGESTDKDGRTVKLTGVLTLQDEEVMFEKELKVFPKALTGDLRQDLQDEIVRNNRDSREGRYYLPDSISGKTIMWYEAKDNTIAYICILIPLIGIFLNISARQKEEEKRKKRIEGLKKNYAELVSRLLMMVYAGSSMRTALFKIGASYRARKKENSSEPVNEAFEEVVILCNEIENGITESKAYENLGERCVLPCYRTLGVTLIRNQKRGSSQICETLEQEVINAFGEKKRQARIAGDAASMKLLLPLGLMLMVAFALMLIPAFLSL